MKNYSNIFWKHASELNKEATLEDVFLKWASDSKLSLEVINNTWKQVNEDLGNFKEARISLVLKEEDFNLIFSSTVFIARIKQIILEIKNHPNKKLFGDPVNMAYTLLGKLQQGNLDDIYSICSSVCQLAQERYKDDGWDDERIRPLLVASENDPKDSEFIFKNIGTFLSKLATEEGSNISYLKLLDIIKDQFIAIIALKWGEAIKAAVARITTENTVQIKS